MTIAYFAHDLNDPAVHRRIRMLHAGGARVRLVGFCRGEAPALVEGCRPTVLGQTHDARLLHRIGATASALCRMGRLREAVAGADAVVARQLEMLVIAFRARRRHAPRATLTFECLDIHRLMLDRGWRGRMMRFIEGRLLRRCDLLLVSSPGFVRNYFSKHHRRLPRVYLSENKVLALEAGEGGARRSSARPAGPPWRIGWFGNIRCRQSLYLLAALTHRLRGAVEVVIRGRPARTAVPDFDRVIAEHTGILFKGPYDRRLDLASIYGEVHFAWTMDFFEAGGNSEWLLPNRLYEGGLYGAVPLAFGPVETGRWLQRQGAGILLYDPLKRTLGDFFGALDMRGYLAARGAVERIPILALEDGAGECRALVEALSV